jgi:hypothetical protein
MLQSPHRGSAARSLDAAGCCGDRAPSPVARAQSASPASSLRRARLCSAGLLVLAAGLGLGAASCGRGFVIVTPSGFAELEEQHDYAYRATNAEGVVVSVRREDNRPYGDLSFWSGALDAHLRRGGYVADKAVDVQSANGVAGRQIRYHTQREGRDFVFWVSVFVTDGEVVVVEAGGDRAHFNKLEAAVTSSLASLEIL